MTKPETTEQGNQPKTDIGGKYLTFALAKEEYGIRIIKVKEIVRVPEITSLPQLPQFIKGVIVLRGKVVPVLDLRLKFEMDQARYDERTCIVVVEVGMKKGMNRMGLIVDSVSDVLNVKSEDIEETHELGKEYNTEYIIGVAKTDHGVKILLDTDKLLGGETGVTLTKAA